MAADSRERPHPTAAEIATLLRLAWRRTRSEAAYREFQGFQARLLVRYLRRYGVDLDGALTLDLGAGIGGYGAYLAEAGARVVALDRTPGLPIGQRALCADAAAIPLRDASVDFVFCASLVEHVREPARVLAEIERVLRGSRFAYVSFPPYWSPLGGHEYSPLHYLGERWALRLRGPAAVAPWVRRAYRANPDARSFAELFPGWGLHKLTLRGLRRLLRASGLQTIDVSTRYLPLSVVRWPGIGEVLTWHAQFLLRKRS